VEWAMHASMLRTAQNGEVMSRLDRHAGEPPASAHALEPFVHEEEVRHYLDLYARALTTGDARAIAAMWALPALVLGDYGAHGISNLRQVETLFAGTKEHYAARGIVDTRPDIQSIEWLTHRIVVADVRWPLLDANHRERGAEHSTYTLERDNAGALKMRVAVMRGEIATEAH